MSYTIQKMRAKIHNGIVTRANLDYDGSVTIGKALLQFSGIEEWERVQVLNITNGKRIETYVIAGKEREIELNGAAARFFNKGDRVIIIAYATVTRSGDPNEVPKDGFTRVRVILNGAEDNLIKEILD